jgi:osmoprotectant transport system substrate-binding protein
MFVRSLISISSEVDFNRYGGLISIMGDRFYSVKSLILIILYGGIFIKIRINLNILVVLMLIASLLVSGCAENSADEQESGLEGEVEAVPGDELEGEPDGEPVPVTSETIVIGTKLFQESYITAHMISLLLDDRGYNTDVKENLGGTLVNYEALKKGDIHSYVDYTGTIYSQILKKPPLEEWDPEVVYEESEQGLLEMDEIVIAASLGFENAYAIAVDGGWAESNEVSTISDLASYAPDMEIGTDPEFATREDGLPQIDRIYGFTFKNYNPMVPGIMYEAIKNEEVDAISAYTTDTRNDLYELKVLEDDKNALPPYDAVVLVSAEFEGENPEVMAILAELDGRIDSDTMRQLNGEYDIEKREARDIARDFLVEEGLISG